MRYTVSEEEHGLSLLSFLHKKGKGAFSLKVLKEAIAKKSCRIGNRIETFSSYKLSKGEIVELDVSFAQAPSKTPEILYEDDDLVIINKKVGSICKDPFFPKTPWKLVHRLDKETSGVLLLAKHEKAKQSLEQLFAKREVQKIYLAICDGKVSSSSGVIHNKLAPKGGYHGQTLYGSAIEGEVAITHWSLMSKGKNSSLVLCDLKTGRTHQIRVHMSEMGHPILGDTQYAHKRFSCDLLTKRTLLHAWKVSFIHPYSQKKMTVTAPLPADFKEALRVLHLTVAI